MIIKEFAVFCGATNTPAKPFFNPSAALSNLNILIKALNYYFKIP
jgi:hypothetical protein